MGLSLSKTAKVDQTSSAKRISKRTSLGKQEKLNCLLVMSRKVVKGIIYKQVMAGKGKAKCTQMDVGLPT